MLTKRHLLLLFLLGIGIFTLQKTLKSSVNPSYRVSPAVVAILQTAPHPALDATYRGILDELEMAKQRLGKIKTIYHTAQNNSRLGAQIAQKYVSESPSVLVGIGTRASLVLSAANQKTNLPLVFASVTDPVSAGLTSSFEGGDKNISGVSNFLDPAPQFHIFKKILPALKKIGVIYNPAEPNSQAMLQAMNEQKGDLELIFAIANSTKEVSQAADQLVHQVDALFINNDNTALSAFSSAVKVAKANSLPIFCSDTEMVAQGALAALGPNQYLLGRQAGKMIIKGIDKGHISETTIELPQNFELYINASVAHQLGITLDAELAQEAKIIL